MAQHVETTRERGKMAELAPYPFPALALRMFRELETEDAIFDLPAKKFVLGSDGRDYSVRFHGKRPSTPLGPAAGPHTQMAQNIVLSFLAGCRVMELKTVQIDDRLEIARPCIDMQTIGYNIEWSQELRLQESLEEYVKASMLVEMLVASGKLDLAEGFSTVVYDMSVGYDLAGIKSEPVVAFMRGMMDASELVERFRAEIPDELSHLRELEFNTCLSDTLTLSTFHGCPPDEIESIIRYLLDEHGLHCIVKLNPTLLGLEDADALLHGVMGYEDITIPPDAFDEDTTWDQMVAFVTRLGDKASAMGLGFGVKFNNTLITENKRDFFPGSEKRMYLSGQPLHVMAMELVRRFRREFGDRFPISFSAGIDRANFADAVALGLVPVTVCSDLLRPGGYGRSQTYFKNLAARMDSVGATHVDDFVLKAYGNAEAALDALVPAPAPALRDACLEALSAEDVRDLLEPALYARWVSAARVLNAETYADACQADPRYALAKNSKVPRKIDSTLVLLDCITCDKCVPVCPNDANFTFHVPPADIPSSVAHYDGTSWTVTVTEPLRIEEKHQIGNFVDFCNDCGNCDVFCPELGGPYKLKPRFHGSLAVWQSEAGICDGFYVRRSQEGDEVFGRIDLQEYQLVVRGDRVQFSGAGFEVRFDRDDPEGTLEGRGDAPVDLALYRLIDLLRLGVLERGGVNYVSTLSLL
jgi:putative selenate reductase